MMNFHDHVWSFRRCPFIAHMPIDAANSSLVPYNRGSSSYWRCANTLGAYEMTDGGRENSLLAGQLTNKSAFTDILLGG